MNALMTPVLGIAGFFAGMLLWTQFTRWVALLYVSGSKEGGDFLGPPKRRLLWAVPFLAVLHPAPWLIGLTVIFAWRGGIGFLAGLCLALLSMIFTTVTALVRWRRSRSN